ncbi:hypothetical protein ABIA32_001015 [Streptacidiphilus sp. MAP12-20]
MAPATDLETGLAYDIEGTGTRVVAITLRAFVEHGDEHT